MFKRKYTHIFFDLDNTLWDFEENSYHALHTAFLQFSINAQGFEYHDFFTIYSKHNQNLWKEYRLQKVVKNELKKMRFQKTFDDMGIKDIDANEMNSVYLSEMPKQTKLVDGAEDVLSHLKSKGYLLYIITNGFREVQFKKLRVTKLSNYFTKIFISEEIKAPKPDRKIFEYAIKSANAPKSKSLMVGDDFEIDVMGALNYGINAVFFNPGEKSSILNQSFAGKRSENFREITSLPELKNIL
jgi:putative hydrolase of the HAD superfamily